MAEKEKVTMMVLKVDLQCEKCYKKVKRVLCKFPQIRDQTFDEKQNQVIIKVVCCSPEKIRDKLCCKGGGAIKSIEILEPPKPKPPEKPKDPPKPKEPEKPKDPPKPKEPEKPKDPPKPKEPEKPKDPPKPKEDPPKPPVVTKPPDPEPMKVPGGVVPGHPSDNIRMCCTDCYHGNPGGPCYSGYGAPAPYIQYDGYYGRPVYDSYGGGMPGNYVTHSQCFSEENPQACTVM